MSIHEHDFEQKWQDGQYADFKNKWDSRWSKFFTDKVNLGDNIVKLEYDIFYHVNNAFGKLDKALQICDFLHKLSKSKPPQDTEKIIVTTLVSCAEAVYRINKPNETVNENLVKGFFKPVRSRIDYKIRGHSGKLPYKKTFDAVEVLYLIRSDYIHNGNFTGIFFRNTDAENHVYNIGNFFYSEKGGKTKFILSSFECSLTYHNFLSIFLEAFIKNIEKYCSNK